ncbi:hypothetical protein FOA52_008012 [Chlamydomonas sp. UWO 241]|nr:hypothetical protein FOA52_008012 [Chlamydomonas sp. UWO 241]
MLATKKGHVGGMRLLLDHPAADPAAMLMHTNVYGDTALTEAAKFAAGLPSYEGTPNPSCAPLLLLLSRVSAGPQPSNAQQAHMTKVMEALFQGLHSNEMFDADQPDDARDDCIRLLLESCARGFDLNSPVVSRIISEAFTMARVPHLLNEAVVGVAIARQQQQQQSADDPEVTEVGSSGHKRKQPDA